MDLKRRPVVRQATALQDRQGPRSN